MTSYWWNKINSRSYNENFVKEKQKSRSLKAKQFTLSALQGNKDVTRTRKHTPTHTLFDYKVVKLVNCSRKPSFDFDYTLITEIS